MSALGSLVVKLALEYAEYTKGLDKSDQASLKFAQNAQKHFDQASAKANEFLIGTAKSAAGVVAAFLGVNAVIESFNRSVDDMAALDDLNQKTGAAVENLSRLQKVAKTFNQDFGPVENMLVKLSKGMTSVDEDGSKTIKALSALGVSAKDAAGKLRDPADVLVDVAKRLQQFKDGPGKTALMEDLVKGGADLLPYLNDLAENVDKVSAVSTEAAQRASKLQDEMGGLRTKADELFTSVATAAVPALADLAGVLNDSLTASNDLTKNSDVANWADGTAVGLARVLDVGGMLVRTFSAVSGSFQVVAADIVALGKLAAAGAKMAGGVIPMADIAAAMAEREAVIAEANARYEELWNTPANAMEQSMLKRIAARRAGAVEASVDVKPEQKAELNYSTDKGEPKRKGLTDYEKLNKVAQERLALTARQIELGRDLTDSETEVTKLLSARAAGTVKLSDEETKLLTAAFDQLAANEKTLQAREDFAKADKAAAEAAGRELQSINDQTRALELKAKTYGLLPDAVTGVMIAELEAQQQSLVLSEEGRADIQRKIDALNRLKSAQSAVQQQEQGDGVTQAKDYLEIMTQVDEVTRSAAAGMAESFGQVGAAIGGLTTAISGYGRAEAAIAAQRAEAIRAAAGDHAKIAKITADSSRQSAQAQLRSYGDMANAAKGFFKENTAGYRAMEGVEKAYRAFEMAMAVESMLTKTGLLEGFTSMFVASKAQETAATVASVGPDVAASMAKGQAAAAAGVANQAQGDPYSAWARMAAMAAVMAALGFAVSGSRGGQNLAAERQESMGTGSVFGDAGAKSESIANSLELLESNSDIQLNYTGEMVRALLAIENSIGGLANTVVRSMGLDGTDRISGTSANNSFGVGATGAALGAVGGAAVGYSISLVGSVLGPVGMVVGAVLGAIVSKLSKVKTELLDQGIDIDRATLGQMSQGVTGRSYSDVKTKKSFIGFTYDNDTDRTTGALAVDVQRQFTQVIANLRSGVIAAVNVFGEGGDAFIQRLDSLAIDIPDISLKGLTGEQIQEKLNQVFGKVADDLAWGATSRPPSSFTLTKFQEVGEGAFETLNRLAANYANLNSLMDAIGRTFGATGYASLEARERLIEMAGGIDKLAQQTQTFSSEFLTEAERLEPVQKYVTEQMAAMGLSGVKTRDQFKEVVLGLDVTTEAGARQYASMMALAGMFDQLQDQIDDLADLGEDLVRTYEDAQRAYKDAIAEVSDIVRGLADNVARTDEAVQASKEAISAAYFSELDKRAAAEKKLLDLQRQAAAETLAFGDSIHKYLKSLDTDSFGGSVQQINALKAQFSTTAVLANGGDRDARSSLLGIAKSLRDAYLGSSGNRAEFAIAQAQIKSALSGVAAIADARAATAPAAVDPILEAQKELIAAEKRVLEYAALAAATGASTDRAAHATAGSTTALLAAFNKATAENNAVKAEYATALQLTSNLALTSSNSLTVLAGALERVSSAQVAVIEARNDLVEYADQIGESAGDLDSTIANMVEKFGSTAANAETLASTLALLGGEVETLLDLLQGATYTPDRPEDRLVTQLYTEVLGRLPDAAGLDFWADAIENGTVQLSAAAKSIALSAATADMDPMGKGAGWTIGQAMADQVKASQWLHTMGVPGFAVGTNYVPNDMLAQIHQGERIIPAADNRELMARLRSGGTRPDDSALIAEIRALCREVAELKASAQQTARNTGATASHTNRAKDVLEDAMHGNGKLNVKV